MKNCEIKADAEILSAPKFVTFSVQYGKPVRYGRESAHKSRAAREQRHTWHSMQRNQLYQGDAGDLQRGQGEVSTVDSAELNSKEILLPLCQHFVNAEILSTREFCQRRNFVNVGIFTKRDFVNAGILSTWELC